MSFKRLRKIVFEVIVLSSDGSAFQAHPSTSAFLCVPVSTTASRHHLRSAARGDLQVLATKIVTFGPRSFASSAPKLWNSLPLPLRDSTLTFKAIRQPAENSFV